MINLDTVLHWQFPEMLQSYDEADTILYALSLGYGQQPSDRNQLRFVYEHGIQAVPTMSATLCHPGFWIDHPATGIDASKAVHGEQRMCFHTPLPAKSRVRGLTRVVDVIDKGPGRGALLIFERKIYDQDSDQLLATIEQRTLCRGDGGYSGRPAPAQAQDPLSATEKRAVAKTEAPPTHRLDLAIPPQAALLYRLSADRNPLHVDPQAALAAGFDRPILHGMCTYGIAARSVIEACCQNDAHGLQEISVRFSAPVFPGETLRTDMWVDGSDVRFACFSLERGIAVITNGIAKISVAASAAG